MTRSGGYSNTGYSGRINRPDTERTFFRKNWVALRMETANDNTFIGLDHEVERILKTWNQTPPRAADTSGVAKRIDRDALNSLFYPAQKLLAKPFRTLFIPSSGPLDFRLGPSGEANRLQCGTGCLRLRCIFASASRASTVSFLSSSYVAR